MLKPCFCIFLIECKTNRPLTCALQYSLTRTCLLGNLINIMVFLMQVHRTIAQQTSYCYETVTSIIYIYIKCNSTHNIVLSFALSLCSMFNVLNIVSKCMLTVLYTLLLVLQFIKSTEYHFIHTTYRLHRVAILSSGQVGMQIKNYSMRKNHCPF